MITYIICLSLNYFNKCNTPMLLQMEEFHSFLWLSNILLCVYIYIYIYIYTHHLFIHSSANRYLDCFHTVAFIKNAL